MNKAFVFILSIIALGCASKYNLDLQDLKFPNPDVEYLAKNSIDTTFLISDNESLNFGGRDTIGMINYIHGRIIADYSNKWESFEYAYDSLGFLTYRFYRDFDVYLEFRPSYTFDPDSLVLYQTWSGDYSYTCKFIFDSDGYLLQELSNDCDNRTGSRRSIKIYKYNHNKKLIEETEIIQKDGNLEQEKITSFFYSNEGVVDSSHCQIKSTKEGQFKVVTYYNDLGLREQTIKQDTLVIRYIHHKRSGT